MSEVMLFLRDSESLLSVTLESLESKKFQIYVCKMNCNTEISMNFKSKLFIFGIPEIAERWKSCHIEGL